MDLFQIIILIFGIFALSRVLLQFKNNKLKTKEFMFWMVIWIIIILFVFIPDIIINVMSYIFTDSSMRMITYGCIILLFYLIFRLYVKIDTQEKEISEIIRSIAIKNESENKKKNK